MNILENELVNKYFGCNAQTGCDCPSGECAPQMAYRILKAMQEVINKGERCLMVGQNGVITETTWMSDPLFGIRSNALRLPSAHQPKAEKELSDEDRDVESNIQSLLNNWNTLNQTALEKCLRWLVDLARKTK
jgi:hypothetical protein